MTDSFSLLVFSTFPFYLSSFQHFFSLSRTFCCQYTCKQIGQFHLYIFATMHIWWSNRSNKRAQKMWKNAINWMTPFLWNSEMIQSTDIKVKSVQRFCNKQSLQAIVNIAIWNLKPWLPIVKCTLQNFMRKIMMVLNWFWWNYVRISSYEHDWTLHHRLISKHTPHTDNQIQFYRQRAKNPWKYKLCLNHHRWWRYTKMSRLQWKFEHQND